MMISTSTESIARLAYVVTVALPRPAEDQHDQHQRDQQLDEREPAVDVVADEAA